VDLSSRFAAAVEGAGGHASSRVAPFLVKRWSEPHRHYHNLDHLTAVLDVIDAWAAVATDPDLVRLAAFFHDVVYDPQGTDNEGASADLAVTHLGFCDVPSRAVQEVDRLVRLTAGHIVDDSDANGILLADADLAVLARDWPGYVAYAEAIRAEYAHVPDDLFRAGRARVLSGLLALPTLYRIPQLRTQSEDQARANMTRELTQLTSP
jgi:predicted metal-dependent HD superfamily phosphohydrolase